MTHAMPNVSYDVGRLVQLVDDDEGLGAVLKTGIATKDQSISRIVADDVLQRMVQGPKLSEFLIKENLTVAEENFLVANFPEFRLKFSKSLINAHGVLAAGRRLCNSLLLNRINYYNLHDDERCTFVGEYDVYVKDYGGNFTNYLRNSQTEIHCCCPIIDTKDVMRVTERDLRVKTIEAKNTITAAQRNTINDYYSVTTGQTDTTKHYCTQPAQKCNITSRYAIMQDSSYDFPLPDLGDAMYRGNTKVLYGAYLFVPEMLTKFTGEIREIGVRWVHIDRDGKPIHNTTEVDADVVREDSDKVIEQSHRIRFLFRDDASLNYEHSTATFMSYCVVTQFASRSGSGLFMLELLENRGGYQFFKIVDVGVERGGWYDLLTSVSFDHTLWLNTVEDRVLVKGYDLDTDAVAAGVRNIYPKPGELSLLKEVKFYAPKFLVERAKNYAKGVTETKFKVEELFNYSRSTNSRNPVGAAIKKFSESLNSYELKIFTTVLYVYVFDEKYRQGKVLQQLIASVNFDRTVQELSTWKKVVALVTNVKFMKSPPNVLGRYKKRWGAERIWDVLKLRGYIDRTYSRRFGSATSGFKPNKVFDNCNDVIQIHQQITGTHRLYRRLKRELLIKTSNEALFGYYQLVHKIIIEEFGGVFVRCFTDDDKLPLHCEVASRPAPSAPDMTDVCDDVSHFEARLALDLGIAGPNTLIKNELRSAFTSPFDHTKSMNDLNINISPICETLSPSLNILPKQSIATEIILTPIEDEITELEGEILTQLIEDHVDTTSEVETVKCEIEEIVEPPRLDDHGITYDIMVGAVNVRVSTIAYEADTSLTVQPTSGENNDCLYRSLAQNKNINPTQLRVLIGSHDPDDPLLIEETKPGNMSGTRVIEIFCAYYSTVVVVYDIVRRTRTEYVPHSENINKLIKPVRRISIMYSGIHYDCVGSECVLGYTDTPIVHDDFVMSYCPLNVILDFYKTTCIELSELSDHYTGFVNVLGNYCNRHGCCRCNNFGALYAHTHATSQTVSGVFEIANLHPLVIDNITRVGGVSVSASLLPLITRAFVVLTFTKSDTKSTPFKTTLLQIEQGFTNCNNRCDGNRDYCIGNDIKVRCSCIDEIVAIVKLVPRYADAPIGIDKVADHVNLTVHAKAKNFLAHPKDVADTLVEYMSDRNCSNLVLYTGYFVNTEVIIRKCKNNNIKCTIIAEDFLHDTTEFVPALTINDSIYNSMIEARELWGNGCRAIIENVRDNHDRAVQAAIYGNGFVAVDVTYGLIDLVNRRWVYQPHIIDDYEHAYDGTNIIAIKDLIVSGNVTNVEVNTSSPFISINRDTRLVVCDQLYAAVKSIQLKPSNLKFHVTMLEGAPGVGKTEYIVRNHDHEHDLVVTATKEAAIDIRKRVLKRHPTADPRNYKTGDSLVINSVRGKKKDPPETLWIDEGIMKHCGEWFWYAYLTGAFEIVVLGDSAQIPYIERTGRSVFYSLYPQVLGTDVIVKHLDVSRRCPRDVVAWLNTERFYKFDVKTTSERVHSVNYVNITSSLEIPISVKSEVVLTFTQGEKIELIKAGYTQVNTIHEFQGKQADVVNIVRTNSKKINTFDSVPHVLVALTRHTQQLLYYTVVTTDTTIEKINTINNISLVELDRVTVDRRLGGGTGIKYTTLEDKPIRFEVILNDSASVLYLEEKILRDFVMLNHETGYISAHPKFVPLLVDPMYEFTDFSTIPSFRVLNPINIIQDVLDTVLPGSSIEFDSYDLYNLHQSFNDYDHRELKLRMEERDYCHEHEIMTPTIRSAAPRKTDTTQVTLTKAFLERNGNVPDMCSTVPIIATVKDMVKSFIRSYVGDVPLMKQYLTNPIVPNVLSIRQWLAKQPAGVAVSLAAVDQSIHDKQDFDIYDYIMKRVAKIDLEIGSEMRFKSPQTIAFQGKDVNAIFCPMVRNIKDRLFAVLKPNVLINVDFSVEDFNQRLTQAMFEVFHGLDDLKFLEVDFSKFDKSQGLLALIFECVMMYLFGVPLEYIDIWIYQHRVSMLLNRLCKFAAIVEYQRKSGDAMTFLGNTLFLMAVIAVTYGLLLLSCFVALFSGDDSIIFSIDDIKDVERTVEDCAFVFNLEIKVLKYHTPYFCSKFIVYNEHYVYLVPDLLKLCVKLGRKDMVSEEHVECYRISVLDNIKILYNTDLSQEISRCHRDRYSNMSDTELLVSALLTLVESKESFASLFERNPDAVHIEYSTLPNLDI